MQILLSALNYRTALKKLNFGKRLSADLLGYISIALENNDSDKVWFSARSRSIKCVVDYFKKKGQFMSELEAEEYILRSVLELNQNNFCDRKFHWGSVKDVYGLAKDGENWFIKFEIEVCKTSGNDYLNQLSFHPTDDDMTLIDKSVLKRIGGSK